MTKHDLPTPALLVNLDRFEANLQVMAQHCQQTGCALRPHAKTHKCPEIARRQIAVGARGISVATVAEAEAMVGSGIDGVLLTSPIVEPGKIARMVTLAKTGGAVLLAVGHALEADLLAEAAERAGVVVDVLLDVDAGDGRFGTPPAEARALAYHIGRHKALRLRGVQAYAGRASHVVGFEAREQSSRNAMVPAVAIRDQLVRDGFDAAILSGASTGTYNIDSALPGMELQSGSYIFMDLDYQAIGGADGSEVFGDFQPSLTVLATVVADPRPDQVTVDAGLKAFATDARSLPLAKDWAGLRYRFFGDEFGQLTAEPGATLPRIGDRLEFYVPHCDPTVNLHDRLYAVRGDQVEAVWPIVARGSWAGGLGR